MSDGRCRDCDELSLDRWADRCADCEIARQSDRIAQLEAQLAESRRQASEIQDDAIARMCRVADEVDGLRAQLAQAQTTIASQSELLAQLRAKLAQVTAERDGLNQGFAETCRRYQEAAQRACEAIDADLRAGNIAAFDLGDSNAAHALDAWRYPDKTERP